MENAEEKKLVQPDTSENSGAAEQKATTPENLPNENSEPTISVKFNKEMLEIPISQAQSLAQKGLKYEKVSESLERLRKMAAASGRNINDYLSFLENQASTAHKNELLCKCSGDESLVAQILSLEGKESDELIGLDELIKNVDTVKSIEDIPEPVIVAAKEKGGNLFDEYLRYQFNESRKVKEALSSRETAKLSTTGPINAGTPASDAAGIQFIKGIWN
ncbi:MAG: hypothetical protein KBS52_03800 [Clostridiales bacterium]|nr:hypothetical protein [Candidatus Equinaster intestinalis]